MVEPARHDAASATGGLSGLGPADARALWAGVQPRLHGELGSDDYRAWIEPLQVVALDESALILAAPNAFAATRVRGEHLHRLQAHWARLDPTGRRVRIVVSDVAGVQPAAPASASADQVSDAASAALLSVADPVELGASPRTFANFELGEANRVAAALARRMAEEPAGGDILFLHGPHGSGKTHLIEAIGARLRETAPARRVVTLTAQRFLNAFQTALRERDTAPFKAALRSAEMLLIDDLQIICGKAATQDEFFQTLDDLVSRGRTVVCTADVPADALQGLSPRMRCVLQGGFSARLGEPDFALRRAIARRKASELAARKDGFVLPEAAFDMIAARVSGTARAVEGAVKQVFAASALIGLEADMDLVAQTLSAGWAAPERTVPVETIKRRVAAFFDLSLEDLVSQRRHRAVARPRQIAMYFCKRLTRRSFPDIGQRFGGRDHTTVMHAVKRIEDLARVDSAFAAELQDIGRRIVEAG